MNSLNNNAFSGPTSERFEATKATQSEAVAGSDNKKYMTPLRTFQSIAAWVTQNLSWATLTGKPSTFPPAAHSHPTSEVTGLDTALAGKAAASHTHTASQITDFSAAVVAAAPPTTNASLLTSGTLADARLSAGVATLLGKADSALQSGAGISNISGLQTALDSKQPAGTYAASTHTHAISDTTGLQTALDGKAATSHTHTLSQLTQSGATNTQVPTWNGTAWVPSTPVVTNFQPNPEYLADNLAHAQASGFDGQPTAIFSRISTDFYQGNDIEYYIDRNGQSYGGVAGSWNLYYQPSDAAGGMVAISTTATTYPWQATWTNGVMVAKAALPRIVGAPLAATAAEGTSAYAARADHVHPLPTPAQIGAAPAGSYVTLDGSGKVPSSQLPSYVDDVVEYNTLSQLQADTSARVSGKIYVVLDTGKIYRWSSGTLFIEISSTLELEDLQIPDSFAGVTGYINGSGFAAYVTGTTNGRNSYSFNDGNGYNWQVFWTGTQWKAIFEYSGDGTDYQESTATGNTTYPWQATGWTNNTSITRVGTYDAALAPAPLGAEAYSGVGTKAAREDHVHPLPTPAQIGSLSLSESSYIVAKPGDSLAAKYTAAKALTPNGAAKSATNRASLIIFPGSYTLSAELAIDAEFVDVIGLGAQTRTPAVLIAGNTLNVSANDVRVSGISVGTQQFKITGNKPSQIFDNCTGGAFSFGSEGTASGTFTNCVGGDISFGGGFGAVASGAFTNCVGGDISFGGGLGAVASGAFTNCVGGDISFGSYGTASGIFANCIGIGSFGNSGTASGTFTNCTNTYAGFGSYGTASGTFTNCTELYGYGFGYFGFASGTFTSCTASEYSFGSSGNASGTFMNCIGGTNSFGGGESGTASGTFMNCAGGASSFGSEGTASGTFTNCRLTAGTYGSLTAPATGKAIMVNCLDGNGNINSGQAPL